MLVIRGEDEVADLAALVAVVGVGVVADVAANDGGAGLVVDEGETVGDGESGGDKEEAEADVGT